MRNRRAIRRQTSLGLAVLVAAGLATWLSTVSIDGLPWSSPYTVRIALPAGAPLLRAGDDVRIGGERVGQVGTVGLAGDGRDRAVATLEIGSRRIGAGAGARVRPLGMAGAVYVELDPGNVAHPRPSGSLVAAAGGVQLTDVIAAFDATTRHDLQAVLTEDGSGLAGRGVAVGDTIARAPALLTHLTAAIDAVTATPGELSGTIGAARSVAGAMAPAGSSALGDDVAEAAPLLAAAGSHAAALAHTIVAAPGLEARVGAVLPGADRLLAAAAGATAALRPGVAALAGALPRVIAIERRAPAVATLGWVAGAALPTLRALAPALRRLPGPASALTPFTTPLTEMAGVLIPYRTELIEAPLGFTRWGSFTYDFGTGSGHRAVRFSMVLTCATARDPYPEPAAAARDRRSCP